MTSSRRQILQDAKILKAIRKLAKNEDLLPHVQALDEALQKVTEDDLWGKGRPLGNHAVCDKCENTKKNCWDCSGTGIDPIPWTEVISGLRKEP